MQIDIRTAPKTVQQWLSQQLSQVPAGETVLFFDGENQIAQFIKEIEGRINPSSSSENVSPAKLLSSGDTDDGSFDECLSKANISLKPAEFD